MADPEKVYEVRKTGLVIYDVYDRSGRIIEQWGVMRAAEGSLGLFGQLGMKSPGAVNTLLYVLQEGDEATLIQTLTDAGYDLFMITRCEGFNRWYWKLKEERDPCIG